MNPHPSDLESAALPVGATGLRYKNRLSRLSVSGVSTAKPAVLLQFKPSGMGLLVLVGSVITLLALLAGQRYCLDSALCHGKPLPSQPKPLNECNTGIFGCQCTLFIPVGLA